MPGPAAIPKEIHLLHGNPSKKKFADDNPTPPVKIPEMPSNLGTLGRRQWRYVAPKLAALGVISESDQTALATYCRAYQHWMDLEAEYDREKKIPTLEFRDRLSLGRAIITARDQLRHLLTEFGMTPSSRGKVRVIDNRKSKSPYDEWKKNK